MSTKYINIDFVKSNNDCEDCDHFNDYVCFNCENEQVKTLYPNAKYFPSFYDCERYKEVNNNA